MDKLLIDFDEASSILLHQVPAPMTSKHFGVIKRECFASEVTGIDDSNGLNLKPGTLIQITPNYRGECCHFMMRDFANWQDKYKTTIYKCSKDDYISVKSELWPYLLALKNDECRIKFVQSVYTQEFDMNSLKLGRQIKIRSPPGASSKYFLFIVRHNGIVEKLGKGYYIGLQYMSGHDAITSEMKCMSRYYEFGGEGIVVPVDWIMLNLYNEEELLLDPPEKTRKQEPSSVDGKMDLDEIALEVTENVDGSSVSIEIPKEIEEQGAIPKTVRRSSYNLINAGSANQVALQTDRQTERSNENSKNFIGSGSRLKSSYFGENSTDLPVHTPKNYLAEIELLNNSKAVKNRESTKCEYCSKKVEIGQGVLLRECLHTFCIPCIRSHCQRNIKCSSIRCPYKEGKNECQFELVDMEIKELGGAEIYNTIVSNRLNKYVESDSNVKRCLNENCPEVWLSSGDNHKNHERCPQCHTNCCFVCNTAHEPSERHGARTASEKSKGEGLSGWIQNKFFGKTPVEEATHNKSNEPNISRKEYNTLRDQTSIVLGTPTELCSCEPRVANCGVVLNCQHKVCRTFLKTIVQEQLKKSSQPVCPMCLQHIDEEIKKNLIGQKCLSCALQADTRLSLCGHSFCQKCANDAITNQAINRSKMTINCTTCDKIICNSDILKYGSEEVFALFKAKVEPSKPIPNLNKQITLNDRTFLCGRCDQRIPTKQGVILANCRDCVCLKCCRDFIGKQLNNDKLSACPICSKPLEKFEEDEIMRKPVETSCNITSLVECLKCDEKFERRLIQKCLECENAICTSCAETTIRGQIKNNVEPNCPFCKKSFGESQITTIMRSSGEPKVREANPSRIVGTLFECVVCDQRVERLISLAKCAHEICYDCLNQKISEQFNCSIPPRCPICPELIDQTELNSIGILENLQRNTEPVLTRPQTMLPSFDKEQVKSVSSHSEDTPSKCFVRNEPFKTNSELTKALCFNKDPFECSYCDKHIEIAYGIVLANCNHPICRDCISEVILQQTMNNVKPKCYLCQALISNEELSMLDGEARYIEQGQFKPLEVPTQKLTPPTCNTDPRQQNLITSMPLQHNTKLFECVICENGIQSGCGIILAKCKDAICVNCISMTVMTQLSNNIEPKCPICQTLITNEELSMLKSKARYIEQGQFKPPEVPTQKLPPTCNTDPMQQNLKTNMPLQHNTEPFKCVICENVIQSGCGIILAKCKDAICVNCISMVVTTQSSNNIKPKCPICQTLITNEELSMLEGEARNVDQSQVGQLPVILQHNEKPFECVICENNINSGCGIVLAKCKHMICRDCISEVILQQSSHSLAPKCHICQIPITDEEIRALGVELHNIYVENRIEHDSEAETLVCNICEDSYMPHATVIVTNCEHRFCQPCIAKALTDQSLTEKSPSCPKCGCEVAGADLLKLGGAEVYKQFLYNKRKLNIH